MMQQQMMMQGMMQQGMMQPQMQAPAMQPAPQAMPGYFDAHVHLFNFFQHSEGMGELLEAMDANGISHAAFNDTEIMYFFSITDYYLRNALKKCSMIDRA